MDKVVVAVVVVVDSSPASIKRAKMRRNLSKRRASSRSDSLDAAAAVEWDLRFNSRWRWLELLRSCCKSVLISLAVSAAEDEEEVVGVALPLDFWMVMFY